MDLLSRIASWLGENEATISAVVGITVLAGVVFAGLRSLLRRRGETSAEKAPGVPAEAPSAADSTTPDLDPLTVPGFEGRPAIAVLPFDNLSGDPEQEYFADGIAEDLITRLSAWRDFPVIARNSSFTYKGKPVDVKQVSRELGVRYVVEGSVRRSSERVRITAQLIDATSGAHVWADTYDRELRDIFTLQDEITQATVGSIYPELIRSEHQLAARKDPQNLDAWECAVEGDWHLLKFTRESCARARSLYERATKLDPALARSIAGLAMTHLLDAGSGWTDSVEKSVDEATRLARMSVELDEREPLANVALAHALSMAGKSEQMLSVLQRNIELRPNSPRGYGQLGFTSSYTGHPGEAIAHLELAMRLSPKDPMIYLWLAGMGFAHFARGEYEEAASWLERSRQSHPNFQLAHRGLAATYAQLGRMKEARASVQDDLEQAPNESISLIRQQLPYADPDFLERYIDGLRKAGLKE